MAGYSLGLSGVAGSIDSEWQRAAFHLSEAALDLVTGAGRRSPASPIHSSLVPSAYRW